MTRVTRNDRRILRIVSYSLGVYGMLVFVGAAASWLIMGTESASPNTAIVVLADFGHHISEPLLMYLRPCLPEHGIYQSRSRPGYYVDWGVLILLMLIGGVRHLIAAKVE